MEVILHPFSDEDIWIAINEWESQSAITCSKLTIETLQQRVEWRRSGIFIVNFEHISHLVLVFLLLTLSM